MVTLNTAIRNAQIQEGIINYYHFDSTNTPSGSYIVSWNGDENKFEWVPNGGLIVNEVPSGSKNGTNKVFTLSSTPVEATEEVYLNGLLQEPGSSNDYTISGSVITFTDAPESGDILLVSYVTSQAFKYEVTELRKTYTAVPYAYYVGGRDVSTTYLSTISRLQFPFNSGTASFVGTVNSTFDASAGCNSSNYGYNMGGGIGTSFRRSYIDRITFPFDSGTASVTGNLTNGVRTNAACNSSKHGYSFVGNVWNGSQYVNTSSIERITFPFDSGTASVVGTATSDPRAPSPCNSSTHGYISGGYREYGVGCLTTIDRITFPFNSGTASSVGNLTTSRNAVAGCNSSLYGYVLGGLKCPNGSGNTSVIERLLFPFNSGTASVVGSLTASVFGTVGANSTNYGYSSGGSNGTDVVTPVSTVDRIAFPFNSGTASHVGNLPTANYYPGSIDGTDFVSMFI